MVTVSEQRSGESKCFVEEGKLFVTAADETPELLLSQSELPLPGRGNLINALAAASVARLFEVSARDIAAALRSFKGLEHRLEFVGEHRGIRFYNDSLSTIPEAAINALDALGSEVETLIIGGNDRGVEYELLAQALLASEVQVLILFPTTGRKVWEILGAQAPAGRQLPRSFEAASMEEAVRIAYRETSPGKICLLSPAASSFGLFRDYRERGEMFKECVRRFC